MRILIFGTVYAGDGKSQIIAELWAELNERLNPDCDLMLVDSTSPLLLPDVRVLQLGDNIGHLARGGQDGWGRAWCAGVEYAIEKNYDYVVHIEGDSLFRHSVRPIVEQMHAEKASVLSVPVRGTLRPEREWVETGLMFMDVGCMSTFRIPFQYDWQDGASKSYPHTPEWFMWQITKPMLRIMPWRAERGDQNQIGTGNVAAFDWVTHVPLNVAVQFVKSIP